MLFGDIVELGGYYFFFDGVKYYEGLNYILDKGSIYVSCDGKEIVILYLEKCLYIVQSLMMIEVGIDVGFICDFYVVFGELLENGVWVVCVYVKLFVCWIWFGGLLMGFGGVLVVFDWCYWVKVKICVCEVLGFVGQGV